tara:strand:- start:8563 stop:8787 length:225 start_codon:yes stop_codon:yes gene_type:complete
MKESIMKLLSFETLRRGDWMLRVSVLGTDNVLVCMHNEQTFETLIRAFADELNANLFIEYVMFKHLLKEGGDYE